jgi:hypothetical protein
MKMVLGKWAWSTDQTGHTHFIVFDGDNTCSFQNLDEERME